MILAWASPFKSHILLYGNGLATRIWHDLPDTRHSKVNYGWQLAILNLVELKFFIFFIYTCTSLKPHILFYSNH